MERRQLITASSLNSIANCGREYYYRYVLGLRPIEDNINLRIGTAWHNAMEARWQGKPYEESLEICVDKAADLDEHTLASLSGLLAGYYQHYGAVTEPETLMIEQEFKYKIAGSLTFASAGKIDCLIRTGEKTFSLLEHKTTAEDISDSSFYWDRLRYNVQLFQYILGVRSLGYTVDKIIYDVTRKPTIQPRQSVPKLDEHGLKIVQDEAGNRVFNANGAPRQTGDTKQGYTVLTAPETPEEYATRLFEDTKERPEFYFQRKEIAVLEQDIEVFQDERLEKCKQILHLQNRAKKVGDAAWTRNVTYFGCRICAYNAFCLQGVAVDAGNPPPGFEIGQKHSELSDN